MKLRRRLFNALALHALATAAISAGWVTMTIAAQGDAKAPNEVQAALINPRLQGQGSVRFLGLRIYDASLWTVAGQPATVASWSLPLAMDIRYLRSLQGQQIAERSLQEMKRQGDIDEPTAQRWLQAMQGLFPDVKEGSRITGVNLPQVGVRFYVDGGDRGAVNEPEFARRFFGIWLSPQSSDLKLRAALLGPGNGLGTP